MMGVFLFYMGIYYRYENYYYRRAEEEVIYT